MHPATWMQLSAWVFRCCLPVETVDVEVRITSMQGTHTFRRDRTCQIIKCNPRVLNSTPTPPLSKNENLPWARREVRPKTPASVIPVKTCPTNYQPPYEKGNQGKWEKKEAYSYKEIKGKSCGKTWIQQHNHMTTCNNFQSPNWFGRSKTFTGRYFREQPLTSWKHPSLCWHPIAQSRKNVREPFLIENRLADPS